MTTATVLFLTENPDSAQTEVTGSPWSRNMT
jgi:hypothetical protein